MVRAGARGAFDNPSMAISQLSCQTSADRRLGDAGMSLDQPLRGANSKVVESYSLNAAGGLAIVALMAAGTIAPAIVGAAHPRTLAVKGSRLLVIAVGLTLLAVALHFVAGLYVGSFTASLGFVPAFSGVFRSLALLASRTGGAR